MQRLEQVLDRGGMNLLHSYVQEELAQDAERPAAELRKVEEELARLKADTGRLLPSLTPVNAEFVDPKLLEIKARRRDLEIRREGLVQATRQDMSLEAATQGALAHLRRFRAVLACGSFAEQKEFLGVFVDGITLNAQEGRGVLRMRDMIAASTRTAGWNRQKPYRRLRTKP